MELEDAGETTNILSRVQTWLCAALSVSRSGFHGWLTRKPSLHTRTDEVLAAKVRSSFLRFDRTCGARRVGHDVLADGSDYGPHRIQRLMRAQALRARPRRLGLSADIRTGLELRVERGVRLFLETYASSPD